MNDVVVVGSANLDLVGSTPRLPAPGETVIGTSFSEFAGGKGLNQAIAASRAGARTALVACVGNDGAATHLLDVAGRDGVDTSHVAHVADIPTGRALIMVDDEGENSIVVVPGANAATTASELPPGRVVLAQLEVPVDAVIAAFATARAAGTTTVLNPAPAAALPPELVALTDILVPNEHEAAHVGDIADLHAAGVQTVVVTLGSRGAAVSTLRTGSVESWALPAFSVDAIDTTGAGDAFCGCLSAGLAAGVELDEALRRAVAAGALATTVSGAVPSLPTADRIDGLVSR
jgi:ribokinase